MKRRALEMLAGSTLVYVLVASCSGGDAFRAEASGDSDAANADAVIGSRDTVREDASPSLRDRFAAATDSARDAAVSAMRDVASPVPDADAQTYDSGSRIKARWLVGDDGARQFWGWYDANIEIQCHFVGMLDGSNRCVPVGEEVAGPVGNFYADAECTRRVFSMPLGCAPRYGVVATGILSGPTCGGRIEYEAFTLGSKMLAGAALYQKDNNGGACIDAPSVGAEANYYPANALVPPSSFVRANVIVDG